MEYLIIALILFVSLQIYRVLARRYKIIDNPSKRSSHSAPVIRGGGIIFYVAVIIFFILSGFKFPYFFLGLTSIAIVSFIDDIYALSPRLRLPFQFIGVVLLLMEIGLFENPYIFLAIIPAVGFINIYNFMDGINGITVLYTALALSFFLVLNSFENIIENDFLIIPLLACAFFSYYNLRKKAKIFAGDIGSITAAMIVLFLVLFFINKLFSPVIILTVGVYIVDAGLTILLRLSLKEKIYKPHRHHIYQKFVDLKKWSHIQVSLLFVAIQVILNLIVFLSYKSSNNNQLLIIFIAFFILSLLYFFSFLYFKKNQMV
ncbi:MAG: UDP-GlcNAc--UDP-phosphate GlcNAc-1-phosphate transferase [Flavobacterium sp.]|nr:UDP-GlcNAc--UDP-phosphate GlcNAc-1-phosphate transferase [Flavobacterium sp.]